MKSSRTSFGTRSSAMGAGRRGTWVGQGIQNGELLSRAAAAGFDALITNDRGIEHEQNQSALPLSVVILLVDVNTIETIRALYANLLLTLQNLPPKSLVK